MGNVEAKSIFNVGLIVPPAPLVMIDGDHVWLL